MLTKIARSLDYPYAERLQPNLGENNYSFVRACVGYSRLDCVAQVKLLNQLYNRLWLYHNFFQPVMRLAEKQWQGNSVKHKYHDVLPL